MASHCPVAIVTGAAQGIGYAISERLLKEGYRVCLADVNEAKGAESLAELQKRYGKDKSIFVKCDVTSETNLQDTFSKAQEVFGGIDLVVNNAGILNEFNPQLEVAVNLMGPILGCQLALKFMGTSHGGKGGVVINTASMVGLVPSPEMPVYVATKHGIVGLTRSYGDQYHLDQNGVMFMAVCPCYVLTPLIKTMKVLRHFEEPQVSIPPEYVAEGVIKLLQERRNGSILMTLPENLSYAELPDELKNIDLLR